MPHLSVHHDEATPTDSALAILQTGHSNNRARSTYGSLSDFYLRNQGLLTIALSQLFFSMMYMGVKVLTMLDTPVPTLELVAVRMGMTWICCQAYMISLGISDPILGPKGVRGWLATRGVVGFFGIFGLYYSLQYMSLSDATVLTFLAPSITALLGFTILHELISRGQVVAGLASLLGVILIARPASLFGNQHADTKGINLEVTESQRMTAVCVGIAGVFATSIAYTSIRVIGKRAHPMHSISYYSIWCVLMGTLGMGVTGSQWVIPTQWTWLATLLFIGLVGFLAQIFLTIGLQREAASRGTLALYTQIVFTVGFEYVAFGVVPPALSILGAAIIIFSAVYVALNKPRAEMPPEDETEEAHELLTGHNNNIPSDAEGNTPVGATPIRTVV